MLRNPVPVIRRFSGGGTVFVDANTLFVTWICNTEHVKCLVVPKKSTNGWRLYTKSLAYGDGFKGKRLCDWEKEMGAMPNI